MKRYLLLFVILLLSGIFGGCSSLPTIPVPSVSFSPPDNPPDNMVFWVVLPDEHAITLAVIPKGHFNEENHYKMWITVDEFREAMKRYRAWRDQQSDEDTRNLYIGGENEYTH